MFSADNRSEALDMQALQQQVTPSLEQTCSAFGDSLSDVVSHFDTAAYNEVGQRGTPTIERDSKLLSFSLPLSDYQLLTSNYQRTSIQLSAQLHGIFFLAESPWAATCDAPSELTCYRRNLFQITGEITVPRSLSFIMTKAGKRIPVVGQELVIDARESTEGNPVKIVSLPCKTPASPAVLGMDIADGSPSAIPINRTNVDSNFETIPFQWKRLHFRVATANNGRRKELQQHFTVRVRVLATLATGGKLPICEVKSGPIIVRGRSPRNFQSRKDLLLTGAGHAKKKSQLLAHSSCLASNNSTNKTPQSDAPMAAPVRVEAPAPPLSTASFYVPNNSQLNLDFYDWKATLPAQPGAMTSIPQRTSPFEGTRKRYAVSSPDITRRQQSRLAPSAPIIISLIEDDSPHPKSSAAPISLSLVEDYSPRPQSSAAPVVLSLIEDESPRPRSSAAPISLSLVEDDSPCSVSSATLIKFSSVEENSSHGKSSAAPISLSLVDDDPPYARSNATLPNLESANRYAVSSPEITRIQHFKEPPSAPIILSLVEDDPPQPKSSAIRPYQRSAKKVHIAPQPRSFSLNTINSPDESADLLYEYFPIGMDDWMPPVMAVYRPHVVHHSKLPSDPRDSEACGRSKRLYSQDVCCDGDLY